jgi:hypothetical protein
LTQAVGDQRLAKLDGDRSSKPTGKAERVIERA